MPEQRRNSRITPRASKQADPAETRSVEAVWRQALLLKEILRDEKTMAHKRRGEAEEARRAAETDTIAATEAVCQRMRAEADEQRQAAREALDEAEGVRAEALADGERISRDAASELEAARKVRADADEYAVHVEANARQKTEAMLTEAHRSAEQLRNDMREETAGEIRRLMEDIDAVRAATSEELETQRILTEAARIRALSPALTVSDAGQDVHEAPPPPADVPAEPESIVVPPVKPRSRASTHRTAARRERAA